LAADVTAIGVGCEINRLFAGQRPTLPIPVAPRREDMRDLFDTIIGPLRGGEQVIIIAGDLIPADALARLSTVRSLLQTDRVATHVTSLPPLATSCWPPRLRHWRTAPSARVRWPARSRRSPISRP
jgi:hypothetical protein